MRHDALDIDTAANVPIQHGAHEIDAVVAQDVRDAQVPIHNLVNAVKGILLVDDGIEEDTEGPDILFLATVWLASKHLGSCIICRASADISETVKSVTYQWSPRKRQRVRF